MRNHSNSRRILSFEKLSVAQVSPPVWISSGRVTVGPTSLLRRPIPFKMARKGRFTRKLKIGPGCQQPQTAPPPVPPPASASHRDDSKVLQKSGDSVPPTSRPFLPPRSVPRPAPQMSTTNIQNSESSHVNSADNANDVDSVDQAADESFVNSRAQNRKGRKTTEFWEVRIIDSDGTIKPARLSVREAMEQPNGRKIVLRFNNAKQAIGNEAGLLSGVLGLLGSDFGKFPICEECWRKITTKDKVYNECVKQIFHIDEDSEGTIKKNILKSMGKSWKETRLRLYNAYFEPTCTTEQDIENRPPGIDREHWRWFLDYRAKPEMKEKCKKNTKNRSKQQYTHTGGSKSFARQIEEEVLYFFFGTTRENSRKRGAMDHNEQKKKDGSYMNDEARAIGERIEEIEQQDESSRVLSQNDFISQVFGKEKPGRVRGMGFGPTPSQFFGPNSHGPGNRVQLKETQRKLLELQAELEGEKLKSRKAMEDEATAEKKKMKAMESSLIYLFQRQGEELPLDITVGMRFVE
ncbi:hypothetical protein Ahy_B05g076625 isoform A [Arachis hypogaea]|uniref:Uncharacterized protein n=1 Tax=Arachis hypogaea TaxID=3818 RepID=A0A444Z3Q2_ARAHY|nr:hypothetical protein Ahy_B05g076625 isoform A [Arachis hypogaea]